MKRTTVRMLLLFFLSVFTAFAVAQQKKTITGSVKDDKGNGLAGVSVMIKGTKVAGATDAQGNFLISTTADQPVLVFSNVGFKSQEIAVAGRTEFGFS